MTETEVREIARLHPHRAIAMIIPRREVADEEEQLWADLLAGGYPEEKARYLDLIHPAMDVVVGRLHDIAIEKDIHDYRVAHTMNQDRGLEITIVFASDVDAMMFKMAVS